MTIDINDLTALLWMLPADAVVTSWELSHDGFGGYELATVVHFAVPPGQPAPSMPRALP